MLLVDEFDDLLLTAYTLYTQKKYDESLAACEKAAKLRPNDNRPFAISGAVYMAQWKMKSASESFAKAIALSPGNKVLYLNKAKADRYRNAKDDASAAARKAIELDPKYAEAYATLADALSIGATQYGEIIELYRAAIRIDPKFLNAYKQLGMFLSVAKDKAGAEAVYREAMKIDKQKMVGRFELGRLLVEQGRLKEARDLWDARTSDTDNTHPNFIKLLERAETKKATEEIFAKNPNDPDSLLQMGLMVMEGESWVVDGRQEKATVFFRKALDLRPNFAAAQFAICQAYVQWADTYKEKNKDLDEEIAKLKKMDSKLAERVIEYRKTYSGGLKAGPGRIDQ